jgi:outer membrane lipoprotein carrier protein
MPGKSKLKLFLTFFYATLIAIWCSTVGLALAATESGKTAEQVIDALQKNYDSTVDFTADFRQQTEVKTLNRDLKAWGKLWFKRPGKMLWRYDEPKGQIVLADGAHLYFLQPEQNQVIKSPLKNAFRSDIPLSFLLGLGNLKKDFDAVLKASDDKQYTLRLEPKGEAGGFSEILMGVSRTSADIMWVSIRDAANNLTSLSFSNMRKGVGVQESVFRIRIPDGVDVVELGQ